jgi:hypothetical protein
MKKFGTPTGAGPGSDSENVGFFADGTPLPVGSCSPAPPDVVLAAFFGFGLVVGAVVWPVDDGFSLRLAPIGVGGELGEGLVVVDELVVVVDDELLPLLLVDEELEEEVDDDEPEAEVELEGELVVELDALLDGGGAAVVALVVVLVLVLAVLVLVLVLVPVPVAESVLAGAATHESVSDAIPARVIGSGIWETAVPGGTLSTVKVYVWPVSSWTVTVQVSANADDTAVNDMTMSAAPAIRSTATSLRRLITAALLL